MNYRNVLALTVLPLVYVLSGHSAVADKRLPSVEVPPITNRIPEVRPPQLGKPDLLGSINNRVTSIRRFRPHMLPRGFRHLRLPRETVAVRIEVKVKNSGQMAANNFRINFRTHIPGIGDQPNYPGSRSIRLGPEQTITLPVWLFFPPGSTGNSIQIYGKIDGCAGVEFAKPYCKVDESNENNNHLRPVEFTIPRYNGS